MLKKELSKIFFYLSRLTWQSKNIEKNIKFLKGPYCKIQTPIKWKLCRKLGKETFFVIKKNFKLALKKKKIVGYKFCQKIKKNAQKRLQPTNF